MIARTHPLLSTFKAAHVKTPRIPVAAPGIVFGSYPQRRNRNAPSMLTRLLERMLRSAQGEAHQDFVARVRTLQPQFAGHSAALLNERVSHLRAELARDGFEAASLVEACALVAVICKRQLGVELDSRGNIERDDRFMSSVEGVFVAGDAGRGQSLIVWAIAEGRSCAAGVDRWLMGDTSLPAPIRPNDRPLM